LPALMWATTPRLRIERASTLTSETRRPCAERVKMANAGNASGALAEPARRRLSIEPLGGDDHQAKWL
jgi:hypothetical protein